MRSPSTAGAARRARVDGTVQGVGFRPYVYRLAGELGLAGWVLNDARGVLLEVEGECRSRRRVPRSGSRAEAPPLAVVERVETSGARPAGRALVRDPREPARRGADAPVTPDTATCAECLARAVRSRRPPLPLPVHQLHQLRPALHDRARGPLRPAADDDGRLRDVPPRARPSTRIPATGASTRSRTPARCAGRRSRLIEPNGRAAARHDGGAVISCRGGDRSARRARSSRSRASAASTSPAAPTTRRRSPRCARASTARTSRSR